MSDNEVAIAIIAVIFGSVVAIVVVSKLIGLAKAWINRNKSSYGEEKFDRLAKAFIKYKKESERRLQNLEVIISDDDSDPATETKRQLERTQLHDVIEVKVGNNDPTHQQKKSDNSNLRNMLKE